LSLNFVKEKGEDWPDIGGKIKEAHCHGSSIGERLRAPSVGERFGDL